MKLKYVYSSVQFVGHYLHKYNECPRLAVLLNKSVKNRVTLRLLLDTHYIKVKVQQSHYSPTEPRGFWEVKASRFRDIGT
jgi:hypothetical protein